MHNFLVSLFAIADLMIESFVAYINGIEDPFYRLMEFCLRYAIYRNFVLAIQVQILIIIGIYFVLLRISLHSYLRFIQDCIGIFSYRNKFKCHLFHFGDQPSANGFSICPNTMRSALNLLIFIPLNNVIKISYKV